MRIKIERKWKKSSYIIGRLYIDDEYICNTLERPWKNNAPNVSCIPEGMYEVKLAFSPKFNRTLPRILNVPGRSGVLIHRGNTVYDSSGCILVGLNTAIGRVTKSTIYEQKIISLLEIAQSNKEVSMLTIV